MVERLIIPQRSSQYSAAHFAEKTSIPQEYSHSICCGKYSVTNAWRVVNCQYSSQPICDLVLTPHFLVQRSAKKEDGESSCLPSAPPASTQRCDRRNHDRHRAVPYIICHSRKEIVEKSLSPCLSMVDDSVLIFKERPIFKKQSDTAYGVSKS